MKNLMFILALLAAPNVFAQNWKPVAGPYYQNPSATINQAKNSFNKAANSFDRMARGFKEIEERKRHNELLEAIQLQNPEYARMRAEQNRQRQLYEHQQQEQKAQKKALKRHQKAMKAAQKKQKKAQKRAQREFDRQRRVAKKEARSGRGFSASNKQTDKFPNSFRAPTAEQNILIYRYCLDKVEAKKHSECFANPGRFMNG